MIKNNLVLYGICLGALLTVVLLVTLYLYLRADGDPFRGAELYVDPDSTAAGQVAEWRESRPEDAEILEKISTRPRAGWFDSNEGIEEAVDGYVTRVQAAGALPVLVAYNIPNRDCSGQSGGGAASAGEYRAWIRAFANGIGDRPAVVILEPDALALLDCLPEPERSSRIDLIRDAVEVLESRPEVSVYVDAGNPGWMEASEMARRLEKVGISAARGFSLNVSGFYGTAENVRYGEELSALTGGKHFVIDTSRNGRGPAPDEEWCNPSGRALGKLPTTETGSELADAYLWVKPPGESDGTCNGGPPAGTWWPDYALDLARRAS